MRTGVLTTQAATSNLWHVHGSTWNVAKHRWCYDDKGVVIFIAVGMKRDMLCRDLVSRQV